MYFVLHVLPPPFTPVHHHHRLECWWSDLILRYLSIRLMKDKENTKIKQNHPFLHLWNVWPSVTLLDPFPSTQEALKQCHFFLFSSFSPALPAFLLTDCGTFQDSFIQHSFTSRYVCPPLLFFSSLPLFRLGFIMWEPNTKTSSHPIFTPLIRFKWHGREGQNGN